jgi:DNA-binding NarL/FixJ family response regulator
MNIPVHRPVQTDSHAGRRATSLSAREQQIVALLHTGLTRKEVAFELRLTDSTVRVHVFHARNKLARIASRERPRSEAGET